MRNGRQRFSQHLSDGRKPREYLAQKILVFLPETVANYKMFPYAAMWTEPRGIILLLLQSNSYFTQIPPIPKGKELQIANAVMETSNSLRTESSILSIRRKEVTAIDTRWVKLGSVQFVPNLKTVATQFRQERATQSLNAQKEKDLQYFPDHLWLITFTLHLRGRDSELRGKKCCIVLHGAILYTQISSTNLERKTYAKMPLSCLHTCS